MRLIATNRHLDLWHPGITTEEATELALVASRPPGLRSRISSPRGRRADVRARVARLRTDVILVNGPAHDIGALLAEDEDGMRATGPNRCERRGFPDGAAIGRTAADRTVARLGARNSARGKRGVVLATGRAQLNGHCLGGQRRCALSQARSSSHHLGKPVFPDLCNVERHACRRGQAPQFPAGVATRDSDLISNGRLARYVLGSYSARKLGLRSTGNAGGVHNLIVTAGEEDFASLLKRMGTGLVVTELMGQGVSLLTGDYSRGASGFWVENGEFVHAVEEITIASNLRDMFANIVAIGSDVDRRSHVQTGSILLERLTVAGA